ncbi:gamma-glutamyltransferase 2. Threonine peptidase. MEROPS family T03 [Bryocella elongata]|uniref:Glutathione hydrolase proenzyme n=1 Tax=Bryocella elongata TaxID=863522 RepID=A0A1H5ZRL4_9BACT|nr:gamma-glutamyltransferase [Bryocella elongata]SEG38297.1 gamma-glutamyltransferase 2. Threonine peptidase. MEROPS family T03 [Bryocella elongata]
MILHRLASVLAVSSLFLYVPAVLGQAAPAGSSNLPTTANEPPFHAVPGQGRSMIVSKFGIVSTPQPLAALAGTHILEQGGNAIDAAIAANAVMGVVQPYVNGIGGDLFVIYYEAKTGKLYGLNASGWTPKALTIEAAKAKGLTSLPAIGVEAIDVPGAVAGWDALRVRFGTMPFSKTLASAIYYADHGYPMGERNSRYWIAKALINQPGWKETYLPNGFVPSPGALFKNPGLANSLKAIAAGGRDAYYNGPMTQKMVDFLRSQGGLHTLEDFKDFQPEWVDPVSTMYRGWKVYELPPNGMGVAALSMLNIMEHFPMGELGHNTPDALHVMIEAKKLAYSDMAKYVGDPRFSTVPVDALISKKLAEERYKLIDMKKASCQVLPADLTAELNKHGNSTIYMSAVDKDGNIVSLIQSNYSGYGTGMVAPGLGFSFHNRGAGFQLTPGLPNSLAGHKRPLHTIIPAFMEKGDMHIGFGIMGGWNQAQAHAQFVANVVDYGMNVQAALEAPRFTKGSFEGCDVDMEETVPAEVRAELEKRGHKIQLLEPFSFSVGEGAAVVRDSARQVNFAAGDPRSDGAAIPQEPPMP